MTLPKELTRISATTWELPVSYKKGMLVPARIIASEKLINAMEQTVFDQAANVACLPGITGYSYCMPDGHWGYGFPIGGVAAMDPENGVISPGGIGFDINCGMRLVLTNLTEQEIRPHLHQLVNRLFARIPTGVGCHGAYKIKESEFGMIAEQGSRWCRKAGYASSEDLELTEEGGCFQGADIDKVSHKAIERGIHQLGTLGSGNHYCEIQVARPENIMDEKIARSFGLSIPNQVVIMFHCGSRGFGHQIATDFLQRFLKAMGPKYGLAVYDRELACAPFRSTEGQDYYAAMKCAVNMAFANRQLILHRIREVFSETFHRDPFDLGMRMLYDVAHNTAKLERHRVAGTTRELLVHRKGATRSLGPGSPELPDCYRLTGQPVIIGGSMETGSYLLAGMPGSEATFATTAHGSGRTMSRHQAKKLFRGDKLQKELEQRGIYIMTDSLGGLAEEAGAAYKDIDEVAAVTEQAGLSRRVVKLTPIGNIKG
ncbi:tRNA-splicing ligase RtcB [Geobacter sp. OR-1]|uniref:RtcB family protein n=1 Tax=Geobacter sp. OR-1 TaxID=1266765 RepID=UPI000541D1AF|nr:RtcB family protein [Geobacter sp. OR-1]GAM09559.1 tRNA-splicing ligase RtcB [Geobacter sp. OR-1]